MFPNTINWHDIHGINIGVELNGEHNFLMIDVKSSYLIMFSLLEKFYYIFFCLLQSIVLPGISVYLCTSPN